MADPFSGFGVSGVADPFWGFGVSGGDSVELKRRRRVRDWGFETRGRHWEGLEREM